MCGRYVLKHSLKQLVEFYEAEPDGFTGINQIYNVAPSLKMPIVTMNVDRKIKRYRWGLVPHWSKGPDSRYSMINARSETLDKKPAYRDAFRKRRCVVPASGFYEWRKTSDGKVPYYIHPTNDELFSFAGLYEHWEGDGQSIDSFTIITSPANKTIGSLHDRMPVMLFGDEVNGWIDPNGNADHLKEELLHPAPEDALEFYPVSKEVNNAKSHGSHLIEPKQDLFS